MFRLFALIRLIINRQYFLPRRPTCSTLFPYTTLFRSDDGLERHDVVLHEIGHHRLRQVGIGRLEERAEVLADLVKRSEEHTSELQSLTNLVCRLLLEKKKQKLQK